MKALSIRQPWAWAILHAGKDVENRDWKSAWAPSGRILIHAAKGCTAEEYSSAAEAIWEVSGLDVPPLHQLPRGGLVGVCRIPTAVRHAHPSSPWAVPGLVHLHLTEVRAVRFVPVVGALGFFEVPESMALAALGEGGAQLELLGGRSS